MTSEDREDIKRHFGVVVEGLRSEIQQVAEGVTANGEALDRFHYEFDAFRTETFRNFEECRADIRSSHRDFDRRLRTVEARHASRR